MPKTIAELCREKTVTVFVDGDRGGDLIIQELMAVSEIDFVTKAPDGKEVEEITMKEIHKALRSKVTAEQYKLEVIDKMKDGGKYERKPRDNRNNNRGRHSDSRKSHGNSRGSRSPRHSRNNDMFNRSFN